MGDFLTQESFEQGVELPNDALNHEAKAVSVLRNALLMPPGSVISIQGSWGRGKTDVLARIAGGTYKKTGEAFVGGIAGKAIWLNPWQYGTPDLLTPLVFALLRAIPAGERSNSKKTLWKAAESLIKAGANFGLKASALALPGGKVLELLAEPIEKILGGLFTAKEIQDGETEASDPDPVAKMRTRFRELTEAYVKINKKNNDDRILICIDDLDRCLPNRQVALLEAICFLASSEAPAIFLIAMDPTLARQAVIAHYGSDIFDPDRYLDKMFHLRISLPAISEEDVFRLTEGFLHSTVQVGQEEKGMEEVLRKTLGGGNLNKLSELIGRAFSIPGLRNPRIIHRVFGKLRVLSSTCPPIDPSVRDVGIVEWPQLFITYLGLSERWPEIRQALQDAGDAFEKRFLDIFKWYTQPHDKDARLLYEGILAVLKGLPKPNQVPELVQLFANIGKIAQPEKSALVLHRLDNVLVSFGL